MNKLYIPTLVVPDCQSSLKPKQKSYKITFWSPTERS